MSVLEFRVHGQPVPQGSVRAFGGHVVHANRARLLPWRAAVTAAARDAITQHGAWEESAPMRVEAEFVFAPLQKHYRAGKLRADAPAHRATRPDLDKLLRALLDALTDARVFRDDAQVVSVLSRKTFGDAPCCAVRVAVLTPSVDDA